MANNYVPTNPILPPTPTAPALGTIITSNTTPNAASNTVVSGSTTMYNSAIANTWWAPHPKISVSPTSIFTLFDSSGKEIMHVKPDGEVEWTNGIQVNEAATALGTAFRLSAESQAGITDNVIRRIRDTVFNEVIAMANEKGPLSAEDLIYMLQAAKIMDKLQGVTR